MWAAVTNKKGSDKVSESRSGAVVSSSRQVLATEPDVIEKKPKMCRVEQLQVVRTLGQGAFGQVSLVYFDDKFYALKAVPRSKVRGSKQAKQVLSERDIL